MILILLTDVRTSGLTQEMVPKRLSMTMKSILIDSLINVLIIIRDGAAPASGCNWLYSYGALNATYDDHRCARARVHVRAHRSINLFSVANGVYTLRK